MPTTGIFKLLRKSFQVVILGGLAPIDVHPGTPAKLGVYRHDGTAIAVQKWMPKRQIAHDLAGLRPHGVAVRSHFQSCFNGAAAVTGMREQVEIAIFANGTVRGCNRAILTGPRIDAREQFRMCLQNVLVAQRRLRAQVFKGGIYVCTESALLKPLDLVFINAEAIAKIASRCVITEWIESHAPTRYAPYSALACSSVMTPFRCIVTRRSSISS